MIERPAGLGGLKKTILSGITTSGNLTIGNYIGAIGNWKTRQKQYDCFYMIADLHGLTIKQNPEELQKRAMSFLAQYLACGLDPKENVIFMQSHVPEHAELTWILNCLTPLGHLNRMAQFKEKSEKNPKNINAGLYTYPILMAADILLYQTDVVPVGEDQRQHLELTRDIAQFFQNRYGGEVFKMPEAYIPKTGAKIMSLQDPTQKMSKSDANEKGIIFIVDPLKHIQKRIKSAVTDSGKEVKLSEENPGVSNLLTIFSALSGESIASLEKKFEGKMYGHLKGELVDLVCAHLKPIQEKYYTLLKDQGHLLQILKEGRDRARERAGKTLQAVYKRIGLVTLERGMS